MAIITQSSGNFCRCFRDMNSTPRRATISAGSACAS